MKAWLDFFVYTESEHINNESFVGKSPVDESKLLAIAAQILDELN